LTALEATLREAVFGLSIPNRFRRGAQAQAHPEIRDVVRTAERSWLGVVELEKRSTVAATPLWRDVGALQTVALEDAASRRIRDSVSLRVSGQSLATRSSYSRQPLSLEIGEQQFDGSRDDDADFATRVRMAHEVPTKLELIPKLRARRELDAVPFRRQRLDARVKGCLTVVLPAGFEVEACRWQRPSR
jgi:hypothetical protein